MPSAIGCAEKRRARQETGQGAARLPLFIVWTTFQRRVDSMNRMMGFEVRYIPPPWPQKTLKPLGYLVQLAQTAAAILSYRPTEIWLQSPPTFLPHVALALRPFVGRYRIVADCHHRALTPNWSRFPGTVWATNLCDAILVHNVESLPLARALGLDPTKTLLLEDAPSEFEALPGAAVAARGSAASGEAETVPVILVPCSFAADEPVPILLAAARLLPEARFLVTGSRRKAEAKGFTTGAPANLVFTDYLPLAEFERLLAGASAIFGLTDQEGIQLSVANEALGAHRALVLSDTAILRSMFGEAALFTVNTPEAIVERLREALSRREELEARSAALAAQRRTAWRKAADRVKALLHERTRS